MRLKVGDTIEMRQRSKELGVVLEAVQLAERDVPDYVEADHKAMSAKLTRIPVYRCALSRADGANLVVEYYSRR